MKLTLIFSMLFFVFSPAPSQASDELETIQDLLNLFEPQAMAKYGKPIQLHIQNSSKMNAYAMARFVGPQLFITTQALKELNDDEVLSTVCHEVGHFFGERLMRTISGLAVEGEADYFSGSCLVKFLREVRDMSESQAIDTATEIAKHEAVAFAHSRVTWEKGYLEFYKGINSGYAPNECRLLTVIHGIQGWQRPKCWYNPTLRVTHLLEARRI